MSSTLVIRPWPDPVLDTLGFDPRSWYVERFWLPTLGPTAVLFLRRVADHLDDAPGGVELATATLSRELGLGERDGAHSPLRRTLARLEQFDLVATEPGGAHYVRRHLPPVQRRHVRRLPGTLADDHDRWVHVELDRPAFDTARRRARRLALTLLAAGDDGDTAERAVQRAGFDPMVATEAVRWAVTRHRDAFAAAHADPALERAP